MDKTEVGRCMHKKTGSCKKNTAVIQVDYAHTIPAQSVMKEATQQK